VGAVTVNPCLDAVTRDLRMEDKIGSIEPGKLADLAVLNKDYFAVTDAEIKQIRSVMTVVDGKIVFEEFQ